jgi:hypothetical protein
MSQEDEYNRTRSEAIAGDVNEVFELLKIVIDKKRQ